VSQAAESGAGVSPQSHGGRPTFEPGFPLARLRAAPLPLGPTVLKKFLQLLLVSLGCLHLAGGPYSLVQVYAWAGMLVSYSQDDGLLQAAKDTFSGEKPCELCHKIAAAKQSEPDGDKEPLTPLGSGKLLQEMIATEVVDARPPRATDFVADGFACVLPPLECGSSAPPIPPPRALV
jgi:hypothetical protein